MANKCLDFSMRYNRYCNSSVNDAFHYRKVVREDTRASPAWLIYTLRFFNADAIDIVILVLMMRYSDFCRVRNYSVSECYQTECWTIGEYTKTRCVGWYH